MVKGVPLKRDSVTKGAGVFGAVRLVGIVVQIITVPIIQRSLGLDAYGAYLLVMTLSVYAALVDVGFSEGAGILLSQESSEVSGHFPTGMYKAHMAAALLHAVVGGIVLYILASVLMARSQPLVADLALFGSVAFALNFLITSHNQLLLAERQFGQVAVLGSLNVIASSILGCALALSTHRAESLLLAASVSGLAILAFNGALVLKMTRMQVLSVPADWASLKRLFAVGKRSYGNRVISLVGGNSDRLVLGAAVSTELLTHYSNSGRIPDSLADVSANAMNAMRARLAQAYVRSPETYGAVVSAEGLSVLMVACAAVAIPSSFGLPLLHIWLGEKAYVAGAAIACCLGYYRALNLYFSYLGMGAIMSGHANRLFPFIVWNASITAGLSYPVVRTFGLVGLGAMNLAINVLQWYPLLLSLRKHVFQDLSLATHFLRGASIVGTAVALSGLALWVSLGLVGAAAWWAMLLAPALSAVYVAVCVETGLVNRPVAYDRARRRLVRVWQKVRGVH